MQYNHVRNHNYIKSDDMLSNLIPLLLKVVEKILNLLTKVECWHCQETSTYLEAVESPQVEFAKIRPKSKLNVPNRAQGLDDTSYRLQVYRAIALLLISNWSSVQSC